MINEKYFLDRLAAGESIEDIGREITDAMNAAATKHAEEEKKKAALAEQEATKHELIAEVFEIMKEFAILEGFDEKLFDFTEEDIDTAVKAFSTTLATVKKLNKINTIRSDDEILRDFFNMFN